MNKISFIGSGNVASHLSKALSRSACSINSISSKNEAHSKELANLLGVKTCSISDIDPTIDLLIISVNDDAIIDVISKIPKGIKSVIHTSGAISMDVFKDRFENFGVFYPLQSFKKDRELDFSTIPILIEGNNIPFEKELIEFAKRITRRVELMDSESRKTLHLAAVFANNFVNLLATEAYEILERANIDGSLIRPLLEETILRLKDNHPKLMQTGPAMRKDFDVLKKHEELLKTNPNLQSLYLQLSRQIMKRYNG
jgi:predicted short-subunit dehydrogenase-like oxidoreductase (DUF2520 family)